MKTYQDDPDEEQPDSHDEHSSQDQPERKSFLDKHKFDERDGPADQERKLLDLTNVYPKNP